MKLINYEEYKNKLLEIRDSIPLTVPAASYELMREKPYTHGMSMRAVCAAKGNATTAICAYLRTNYQQSSAERKSGRNELWAEMFI